MVVCPSCGSSRIRNDYKPAPLVLRVIGVRALLCDYCNRQFRAFSPAPPPTRALRNNTRKLNGSHPTARSLNQITRGINNIEHSREQTSKEQNGKEQNGKEQISKEQIRLELAASRLLVSIEANQDPQIKVDLTGFVSRNEPQHLNGNGSHAPIQPDLRSEIAHLQDLQRVKETQRLDVVNEKHKPSTTCPECGSNWVRRRQRSGLERVVFALTNHKAFICRSCDASFYTRIDDEKNAANIMSRSAQT
jgi:transposase-like protein